MADSEIRREARRRKILENAEKRMKRLTNQCENDIRTKIRMNSFMLILFLIVLTNVVAESENKEQILRRLQKLKKSYKTSV